MWPSASSTSPAESSSASAAGCTGWTATSSCCRPSAWRPRASRRPASRGRRTAVSELDVRALQQRLADFAAARDWGPYHTPKNLASALSVEAAELLEIFQWLTPVQSARVMEDPATAPRVADEVADVLAYL